VQIAPQTVVVTLLQHQIANERRACSKTFRHSTRTGERCDDSTPVPSSDVSTPALPPMCTIHSTGHSTVDSMVDSPRGNPRHTAHQASYRFRASSRPDSQQAPRPPQLDHPSTRRPPATAKRHRDVASILLDDRYRLVESISRYADGGALWLMRFFGRFLVEVVIYNRTSLTRSRPPALAPSAGRLVPTTSSAAPPPPF
jgi:hypothetical protein